MEKGSHLFVVENYSLHKGIGVNKAVESEEFIVGEHGWAIRLYPDGKTIDAHNSGSVSLYIRLNSSTSTTVQYLFAMYLLDQSGKGNDWVYSNFDEHLSIACVRHGISMGCPKFIKRASLASSGYLKDDCLRIRATIGVLTCQNQNLPIIKVPEPKIWADFGMLLQSKQGADVFFKVENERFCAHKWILAARCSVFLSHLSDCLETKEIDIPDMEPKIFKAMLWFVYTGILPEDELDDSDFGPFMLSSFMGKLLAAADRFELKRLKKICESRICERISGESVAYLFHLAELCHAKELKASCLRFGAENEAGLLDVMDSDVRKYLKETCPLLFLELAYKGSYSINGRQEHDFCGKIFSTMKETFVSMLRPQHSTDKHKMKEV